MRIWILCFQKVQTLAFEFKTTPCTLLELPMTQEDYMLLTLLETLRTTGIQPENNLLLIASVGEEGLGDLRGVKHLFRKDGPKIDKWISVDGGS